MQDRILLQTVENTRLLVSDRTDVCCCSCLTVTLVESGNWTQFLHWFLLFCYNIEIQNVLSTLWNINVIGYETMTSDHYRTSYDLRALISTHGHGPLSQDTKIVWIHHSFVIYLVQPHWQVSNRWHSNLRVLRAKRGQQARRRSVWLHWWDIGVADGQ